MQSPQLFGTEEPSSGAAGGDRHRQNPLEEVGTHTAMQRVVLLLGSGYSHQGPWLTFIATSFQESMTGQNLGR
jgi:hypothetical protein